jgi:hypothetical protein
VSRLPNRYIAKVPRARRTDARVVLAGRERTVHLFYPRACHCGAAFCVAFGRCGQQAFVEGDVEAFAWFGGGFARVR